MTEKFLFLTMKIECRATFGSIVNLSIPTFNFQQEKQVNLCHCWSYKELKVHLKKRPQCL